LGEIVSTVDEAVTIRTAVPEDLGAVLELALAFYTEDGFTTPVGELRENLAALVDSPDARVAVADMAGVAVGFAITTTSFGLENGRIAELEDLFVAPDRRVTGLGVALIEDSVGWCRDTGCRLVEVVIAPNGQDVSHLFEYYERRGFVNEGRTLLVKELTTAGASVG
jgi:aminoglycoside 6'-N-acetyltransferase I